MTLGERICQYRVRCRLSQQEVAEKLEVSRQSVSKWETDGAVPELDKLVKLCELFEVSLDELVRGDEPRPEGMDDVPAAPPRVIEVRTSQERTLVWLVVGCVLLASGLLGFLILMAFSNDFTAYAFPFALFGVVCLVVKEKRSVVLVSIIVLFGSLLHLMMGRINFIWLSNEGMVWPFVIGYTAAATVVVWARCGQK